MKGDNKFNHYRSKLSISFHILKFNYLIKVNYELIIILKKLT